jgi:large subunit ribosomal protein L30
MSNLLRITWVKSDVGYNENQKRTIRSLGFHHLNQTIEHEDTRPIRGMIVAVRHLVKVEEVKGNIDKAK